MAKIICISSDVEFSHLSLDYYFLMETMGLNLSSLINEPISHLNGNDLVFVKEKIEKTIVNILSNRKDPDSVVYKRLKGGRMVELPKSITEIEYGDKIIKVDLRDNHDFNLCAYIDILSMIITCIELKGSLWFFNRELLEMYEGVSIIGYLRINGSRKKADIENGLNELWKKLKINSFINADILTKGLNNLKKFGLVDYDKRSDEYCLTARGFMFW
jgi:hypothetical protein